MDEFDENVHRRPSQGCKVFAVVSAVFLKAMSSSEYLSTEVMMTMAVVVIMTIMMMIITGKNTPITRKGEGREMLLSSKWSRKF